MSEYSNKKNEEFSPVHTNKVGGSPYTCLLYTSDAADD